ncbi:MAG: sulfotransferase, partial [Krumholzibacteria bacterium]|nr:sulfotransferase [Candidatus Krumholzibacteria bacterium]
MPLGFTFLMCSERSGSNLIARMFDAHPDCCGPSPTHLVRVLAENRGRYGDLDDDRAWGELCRDAADLLATKVGAWQREWSAAQLSAASPRRSLAALVRAVFAAEAKAAGKGHLFIKENHLYRYLPFVLRAFPGLRIVAMVRDPRDMALSWKRSPILRGDVVRAARIWQEDQEQLIRVLGFLEPGRDIHLLRYEDLVADPAGALAAACAAVGLPMDPAMLAFHGTASAAAAAVRTDDWKNLGRPVMAANFGKWRDGLDAAEAAYVERLCGPAMAVFGYACETDDPRTTTELEAELLPRERHEKSGWDDVPADEQRLRRERAAVLARIAERCWQ